MVNTIPKFIGQEEEIQIEEFVGHYENYTDFVGWTNDEQGENEDIVFFISTLPILGNGMEKIQILNYTHS
jgi:hypothetical protein